tara:strand:+ start:3894 stop:5570 length:1677 start_codon:yes stop_codon:yes gene_type:complete
MTTISQSLFSYIDELISHTWVDWVEGPLSSVPSLQHRGAKGFQQSIDVFTAGPRTRAGEIFKLGILSGRLIKARVKGAPFPSGWKDVIEGRLPSTRLGDYSYIIGKSARLDPGNQDLQHALNCLASILILHIGFKVEDRWYSTVLLFQFALNQLQKEISRNLNEIEIRYLSIAIINTLNSDHSGNLIEKYKSNKPIESLIFELSNDNIFKFKLSEIPDISTDDKIGLNDSKSTKAALFWAHPPRGIYVRAARSPGINLIQELLQTDLYLCNQDRPSLLSELYEATSHNKESLGIFEVANEKFSEFSDLFEQWQSLEASLFNAVNRTVEDVNLHKIPKVWIEVQNKIRDEDFHPKSKNKDTIVLSPSGQGSISTVSAPQIFNPTSDVIQNYIKHQNDSIVALPPTGIKKGDGSKPVQEQVNISTIDYKKNDEKNLALGKAGEEFIFEYEKFRLGQCGKENLSKKVQWVARDIGDGLGYDIKSFTETGKEIYLEVKTTSGGINMPFFVSRNEADVSAIKLESYRLVRVFDFHKAPKFFVLIGSLYDGVDLEPISFRAKIK